jgi:phosphoribosylformimino-5-aminoimidazole carboxamide ribotide isomerase
MGAILGRAIYEGSIDLEKGQALANKLNPPIQY